MDCNALRNKELMHLNPRILISFQGTAPGDSDGGLETKKRGDEEARRPTRELRPRKWLSRKEVSTQRRRVELVKEVRAEGIREDDDPMIDFSGSQSAPKRSRNALVYRGPSGRSLGQSVFKDV